jgi:hypothetical protein
MMRRRIGLASAASISTSWSPLGASPVTDSLYV